MEFLDKLFGSASKVKIIRLFVFNGGMSFDIKDISDRSKVNSGIAKREISLLESMSLIRKKEFYKDVPRKRGGETIMEKKKVVGWTLNEKFSFLSPLHQFLIDIAPLKHSDLIKRLSHAGRIKLIITSGVFIQDPDSRVDILIVGDNLKKNSLDNAIRTIESEIGKELAYSAFETSDFQYRLSMCDKLIRDILDFPHKKVLDRIGVEDKVIE